ncbi:thioesterase family protein [Moraxella marmotae]|uniref:thioesterase family protein n=1 Tax=Moraxella marmotae TaxID=3344520 RepID=UPI0035F4A32D
MDIGAKFCNTYKVYINHTDAGGIVYHANHLVFFEHCRRDWLTSLGYDGYFFDLINDDTELTTNGYNKAVHFVVSHADLAYHSPLFVDDVLSVCIDDIIIRPASLILYQSIYRANQPKAATTAKITLACVQNDGQKIRPYRLPMSFVNRLNSQANHD